MIAKTRIIAKNVAPGPMAALSVAAIGYYAISSPNTLLSGADILLASVFGMMASFAFAMTTFNRQSSLIALAMGSLISLYSVWLMYDYHPFYEESILVEAVKRSESDPDHFTLEWMVVANGVYYAVAGISAVLSAALTFAFFSRLRSDLRTGGEIPDTESPEINFGGTSRPTFAPVAVQQPAPQSATPLQTRDTIAEKPRLTFANLTGMDDLKAKLKQSFDEWWSNGRMNGKNGILLYGEPGTGKTAFAEAVAGELGLRIMKVNFSSMASRWVNQTTEQFMDIVDSALRWAPCVLFMDELDTILPARDSIARGDSEENKVVTAFLSAVEKLRNGRVLLIAATNYYDRLDTAAARQGRFDFHIEVPLPDAPARRALIEAELRKAKITVDADTLARVVKRWGGFNVPRIQNATQAACKQAMARGSAVVEMIDFFKGLREVQGNQAGVPEGALSFDELYLDADVKKSLTRLVSIFGNVDKVEELGGKFPNGVVFHGPPGTGKTAMAKALAKASGWAFIPTTGRELLEPGAIERIARKASDLRPAIVFIDEADDILADRSMSAIKLYTNELLTVMSGAGMELHDVVWIAATNDIDSFDEAALRRFDYKIEMNIPGVDALYAMIRDWGAKMKDKIAGGNPDAWAHDVARALEGIAPANVARILDIALNNDVADAVASGTPVSITVEDVIAARKEMML